MSRPGGHYRGAEVIPQDEGVEVLLRFRGRESSRFQARRGELSSLVDDLA